MNISNKFDVDRTFFLLLTENFLIHFQSLTIYLHLFIKKCLLIK